MIYCSPLGGTSTFVNILIYFLLYKGKIIVRYEIRLYPACVSMQQKIDPVCK